MRTRIITLVFGALSLAGASSAHAQAVTTPPVVVHRTAVTDTTKKKMPVRKGVRAAKKPQVKPDVKKPDTTRADSAKKKPAAKKPRKPETHR